MEVGFYWVKVEGNSRVLGIHFEPAYYNGEEVEGWGLCGQDSVLDEDCFLEIVPMIMPEIKS